MNDLERLSDTLSKIAEDSGKLSAYARPLATEIEKNYPLPEIILEVSELLESHRRILGSLTGICHRLRSNEEVHELLKAYKEVRIKLINILNR